jgi:hypothetical protein
MTRKKLAQGESPRKREDLTPEEVRTLLHYSPQDGTFTRLVRTSVSIKAGDKTGYTSPDGYTYIPLFNINYSAHRLAWFYTHGVWPKIVDHINGDKSGNRLCNLRNVSHAENCFNRSRANAANKTGVRGVEHNKRSGRYVARVKRNGVAYYFGTFKTLPEAEMAVSLGIKALGDKT